MRLVVVVAVPLALALTALVFVRAAELMGLVAVVAVPLALALTALVFVRAAPRGRAMTRAAAAADILSASRDDENAGDDSAAQTVEAGFFAARIGPDEVEIGLVTGGARRAERFSLAEARACLGLLERAVGSGIARAGGN